MNYFKLKHLVLVVAIVFSCGVGAQTKGKSRKKSRNKISRVTEDPQLMADKVTVKKQIQLIDSLMLAEEIEGEELLFPSDELYGSWEKKRVNPYADNVEIPDSFDVDLTNFVMPFEGRITSPFGPRRRRMHNGTDIKVQVGDTIRAAFDGKVRMKYFQRRGYGYYVVLRHHNGLETVYGHLSKFLVDSDETVKAGQPIALGGNTGRSTGPHLHFETRFLGQPIDPSEIIDFENFVAHTDSYTFTKRKSSPAQNNYSKGTMAYHRIKKGDSIYSISKKYGLTVNQLCKLNNIKMNAKLKVGSSLRCS